MVPVVTVMMQQLQQQLGRLRRGCEEESSAALLSEKLLCQDAELEGAMLGRCLVRKVPC